MQLKVVCIKKTALPINTVTATATTTIIMYENDTRGAKIV